MIESGHIASERRPSNTRRLFAMSVAFSSVLTACGANNDTQSEQLSTIPIVEQIPNVPVKINDPVETEGLAPAVRNMDAHRIIGTEQYLREHSVRILNCSGTLIENQRNQIIGAIGARHCMALINNQYIGTDQRIYPAPYISTYNTEYIQVTSTDILEEKSSDTQYIGLNGHTPQEVKQEIINGLKSVNFANMPIDNLMYAAGTPVFNQNNRVQIFNLYYQGITTTTQEVEVNGVIESTEIPVVVTSGYRTVEDQSCSWGSSSMALHVRNSDRMIPIGPLINFIEFSPVKSIAYSDEYGEWKREELEQDLGHEIEGQYVCMFPLPSGFKVN